MGVGIHGEPGRRRTAVKSAAEIAAEIVSAIVADLTIQTEHTVLLLLNGFGATPASELYLMCKMARRALHERGIAVNRSLVGSFVTSLDMAGCSITVTALDEAVLPLWDAPVATPALHW